MSSGNWSSASPTGARTSHAPTHRLRPLCPGVERAPTVSLQHPSALPVLELPPRVIRLGGTKLRRSQLCRLRPRCGLRSNGVNEFLLNAQSTGQELTAHEDDERGDACRD